MKISELLCVRVLIEQLIKKSKQIFEHFIWTSPQFRPEIMWEQWETSSLLPTLSEHLWDLVAQNLLCDFIFPTICAHLKPQPETVWNTKLTDLTCTSVKLPYLCHTVRVAAARTGLLSPSRPSLPTGAQGTTCVCISAYDSNHAPACQGCANGVGHPNLSKRCSVHSVYLDVHTGFSKNQR